MSKTLVVLNLALIALAAFFARDLAGELSATRPLPVPPQPRPAASAPQDQDQTERPPRPDPRPMYSIVAAKSLFSPTRSETVAATTVTVAPPQPKPYLHGVVLDDAKSRAYLEDPTSKRIFGYTVGDSVSGGKLEAIRADRVVIVRPEGSIEVMLRDPAKPRPASAVPPPAATGTRPTVTPSAPPQPTVTPPPGAPPQGAPRPLQSLPPQVLRRLAPSGETSPQPEGVDD